MIWPLRTSFKAVYTAAILATAVTAAPVSGRVELRDSKDAAVRKGMDYSGVVVWLEPVGAAPAVTPAKARMVQKDKTFTPHVLPIVVGSTVEFPNFDPIFHNAFSNYNGRPFDVGLYQPGSSRSVRFGRAGEVRVFCNIHAAMSAVILVLNTPYFAATAKDGTFRLPDVPAGEYTLRVFHERATQATLDPLTRRVAVGAAPLALPAIAISESGYIAIPHSNKYGHEYHEAPDDGGTYPAVRK